MAEHRRLWANFRALSPEEKQRWLDRQLGSVAQIEYATVHADLQRQLQNIGLPQPSHVYAAEEMSGTAQLSAPLPIATAVAGVKRPPRRWRISDGQALFALWLACAAMLIVPIWLIAIFGKGSP
jgi:hypothetical protein